MAIRFFFEYKGRVVQLPVNPPTLSVDAESNNKTMEIVSVGEINILRGRKLATCEIDCFFPSEKSENAPYVLTQGRFEPPEFYIDFFQTVRDSKLPVRLIVTDTEINMLVSIESFIPTRNAMDDDIAYKLQLKEYRPYGAKVVVIKQVASKVTATKPTDAAVARPKTGFAVGDTVTVNGRYYYSSTGASPFGTFKNFKGKISHVVADKSRTYRFHITTPTGGFRGWVSESQLSH